MKNLSRARERERVYINSYEMKSLKCTIWFPPCEISRLCVHLSPVSSYHRIISIVEFRQFRSETRMARACKRCAFDWTDSREIRCRVFFNASHADSIADSRLIENKRLAANLDRVLGMWKRHKTTNIEMFGILKIFSHAIVIPKRCTQSLSKNANRASFFVALKEGKRKKLKGREIEPGNRWRRIIARKGNFTQFVQE